MAWAARVIRRLVRSTQGHQPRPAVLHVDETLRITRANTEAERLTGLKDSELRASPIGALMHGFSDQSPQIVEAVLACIKGQRTIRLPEPIDWHTPEGHRITLKLTASAVSDLDAGARLRFDDITASTNRTSGAHPDAPDSAPARLDDTAQLLDRLEQALANAQRRDTVLALLAVDLPDLQAPDAGTDPDDPTDMLNAAAASLQDAIRRGDTIAHWQASSLMVLLDNLPDRSTAIAVAHKLLARLDRELEAGSPPSSSIGISLGPTDSDDAATLLSMADKALYRGKLEGTARISFYSRDADAWSRERRDTEAALRQGLEKGEFELFYQPQIDISSGRLVGLESLIRWHRPNMGLVKPAAFISVAEESGLIRRIGDWAITTAMTQLARWEREGLPSVPLAINVSARQCMNMRIVDTLRRGLGNSGLKPSRLKVELSESTAMGNSARSAQLLQHLHQLGVRVAVDNFGTGYSSLPLLQRFPVSELKIDRRFVSDVDRNGNNAIVVRGGIALAHGLGLTVVAEGVETQAQLRFLADHGCNVAQGYLFAKALPATEIRSWLSAPPPHAVHALRKLAD